MPTVTINKQKIYYTDNRVRNEAPTLVLVHGAGGTHFSWGELRTAKFAAAYSLDLPGHGRSQPPSRTSVEAYADDVAAFVAAMGLPQVVLGGISMGGAIAQTLALRQPDWLSGLLLVATAAHLPVADAILHHIQPDFHATMRLIAKLEWPKGTPDEIVARSYQELANHDPALVYADFAACHAFDVRDRLSEITVPALVLAGDSDRMTSLTQAEFLAQTIPQARFQVIEEAGHMVALARPQAVAEAVESWYKECFIRTT